MPKIFQTLLAAGLLASTLAVPVTTLALTADPIEITEPSQVQFRSETIDGVKIAYREAGDPDNPTVLLLHGFPTSSHMFRNLIPDLAERFHVLAPDYPGFGASGMLPAAEFEYSFANIADMMTTLLDRKGVDR